MPVHVRLSGADEPVAQPTAIRELLDALPRRPRGSAQVLVIEGADGAGKTRLLHSVTHPGATVRHATCDASTAGVPFGVARTLLHEEAPPGDRIARYAADHRTLRDLYARALTISQDRPLIIGVDDAQWCDDRSLQWLHYLLRRGADQPILAVLTLRRRERAPVRGVLAEILGDPKCVVVGLDASAARPSFEELFQDRPHLHDLAVAAAVLGSDDPGLIAALCGVPPRVSVAGLDTLRASGVLAATPGEELVPPSLRAHLIDRLPVGELQQVRLRAAHALNETGQAAERVADQLLHLDDLPEAWMLDLLREAAVQAGQHNGARAARLRERVLRADPDSTPALIDLAWALLAVDPAKSLANFRSALRHVSDPRTRGRVVHGIGLAALATADEPTAPYLLHDAMDALEARADTAISGTDRNLIAELEATLAAVATMDGSTFHTVRTRIGTEPAIHSGTPSGRRLHAVHAMVTAIEGSSVREAEHHAAQVLEADIPSDGWSVLTAASVLFLADHTAEALDTTQRVVTRYQQRDETWGECQARGVRAHLLWEVGDLAAARREADTALRTAQEHGWYAMEQAASVTKAAVLIAQSQILPAEAILDDLDVRRVQHDLWQHAQYLTAVAAAAFWRGDSRQALRLLRECGRGLGESGAGNPVISSWWMDEIVLLHAVGSVHEARRRSEQAAAMCQSWDTARSRGMYALARAVLATGDERVALLGDAIAQLAASPAPRIQIRALHLLGETLFKQGDHSGARRQLREAMALSTRLGHTTLAAHSRNLLHSAGGRTGAASSSDGELSASERAVAQLAAAGATNREIAEELFITVRTVEFHLTNVYRRIGVRKRSALADVVTPVTPGGQTRRRPARHPHGGGEAAR
jgi:DNA-binding CsgD family transcriptional regulator